MSIGAVGALATGELFKPYRDAAKAQKESLRLQERAQREAETNAIRQRRENAQERNRIDQRTPDIQSILARQQKPKANTLLTGDQGAAGLGAGGGSTLLGA